MTDTGDTGTNLANTIGGLEKFNGSNPADFKAWMKKFSVVIGVTRRDILPLLKEEEKPTDAAKIPDYNRANEDHYAMLYLVVELPEALCVQKYEDESEISGDEQAAFKELCGNYNKVADECIRATMEELVNTPMEPGQNPDDYFNKKRLLRIRIEKMGENVSDRWLKDICVTGFTDEYKDLKMIMYRDSSFDIDQMRTTMRHMFLDQQSRSGTKGRIVGRGTAMTTKTSADHDVYCFKYKERGNTKRNCPKFKPRAKPDGAAKGCSVNRTPSYSDDEGYSQGATRPNKKASISLACASCAHYSSENNKSTADTTAAAKDNESPDSEKLVINFAGSNNDFDGGFTFTAAATRRFTPNTKGATLLIDSGASESFLDYELIPGLKERMREFNELSTLKEITTIAKHTTCGVGTGSISFAIRDSHGAQLQVNPRALIVPGLGRNIFAPTTEVKNGVRFVLEVGNPHLTISEVSSFRSNRTLEIKGCGRSASRSSATLRISCSVNPRESPTMMYLGSRTPPQLTPTSGTEDWDT